MALIEVLECLLKGSSRSNACDSGVVEVGLQLQVSDEWKCAGMISTPMIDCLIDGFQALLINAMMLSMTTTKKMMVMTTKMMRR